MTNSYYYINDGRAVVVYNFFTYITNWYRIINHYTCYNTYSLILSKNSFVRLFSKFLYYIILAGTFDVNVVLQSWERKGGYNEEKSFYNKSPSSYCYHFITPYLTGNINKNMTLFHLWLSVKTNFLEVTFTCRYECSSFLFYARFLAYILIIA